MTGPDFGWTDTDTDDPNAVSRTLDGMACSLKDDGWYNDATRLHVAADCIRSIAEASERLRAENEALRNKLNSDNQYFHIECQKSEIALLRSQNDALRESQKAASQPVPEGYVLVPVEPTPKMLCAMWEHRDGKPRSENEQAEIGYRAMLAAAPKPDGGRS